MVARVYDRVAVRYDEDWAGLYAAARACSVEQIQRACQQREQPVDAVEFGVGTGNSLLDLEQFLSFGKCIGFDLSSGMLRQAEGKLGGRVELLHEDALRGARKLPPNSADLVLSHFLLSFVAAQPLLDAAYRVLRPGGLLSLATSTRQSLRELYSGRFSCTGRLLGVRRALHKANTPADHRQCLELLRNSGFEIVTDCSQRRRVVFESFTDVRDWALNSGWAASSLDDWFELRIAVITAFFTLARVIMYPLYPIEAHSEISIVLARKPGVITNRAMRDSRHGELSV